MRGIYISDENHVLLYEKRVCSISEVTNVDMPIAFVGNANIFWWLSTQ